MAGFKDAGEVYEVIGAFLAELVDDEVLVAKFKRADTILRYEYRDPEAEISIRLQAGRPAEIRYGECDLPAEIVFRMAADTANRFWLGRLNATRAIARGEISVKGPVSKLLKLVPAIKPAFSRYRKRLEQAGRVDLLEG